VSKTKEGGAGDVFAIVTEEELAWLERRRRELGLETISEAARQIIRDDMERERAIAAKRKKR